MVRYRPVDGQLRNGSGDVNLGTVNVNVSPSNHINIGSPTKVGTGTSKDDILSDTIGNNVWDGSAGIDTVKYSGSATHFTNKITKGAATSVQDRNGAEGTDSLTNVEKLDFSGSKDVDLSILDGVANISASQLSTLIDMYIAYFNRAPDAEGLFYWGTRLSDYMTIEAIAKSFFV